MTNQRFEVDGKYDRIALHRGLMEARFCEIPNDLDVSGSPILSAIHRNLVDAIIAGESPRSVEQWQAWLQISDERREWNVALGRAIGSTRWNGLDESGRRKLALDLLAPFTVDGPRLEAFIDAVEKARAEAARSA